MPQTDENNTGNNDDDYRQACLESRDSLKAYGLDADRIEGEVRVGLAQRRKSARRRFWVRLLIIAASVLLLVNGLIFLMDFAPAKAYQNSIRKLVFNLVSKSTGNELTLSKSSDIEQARKKVPFPIATPHWLPDGYELSGVRTNSSGQNEYTVIIKYKHADDQIEINITNNDAFSDTLPAKGSDSYEKVKAGNLDIYMLIIPMDDGPHASCHYINEKGLHVFIGGKLDKQSLLRIIESMR